MSNFPHKKIAKTLAEGDTATTNTAKGKALEEVVQLSFGKIKGVRYLSSNILNAANSSELDVVLFNSKDYQGLSFLPNLLVFECKNWHAPVDSASVRVFRDKLRSLSVEAGILLAANGITGGSAEVSAAHEVIWRAYIQDKMQILVFTRAEIESFKSTKDIIEAAANKYGQLVLQSGDV